MRRALTVAVVLALLPLPAPAEIVVLTSGDFLKVDAHRVIDGKLEVQLPFGGRMVLRLAAVERVLDDEVVEATTAPPEFLAGVEVGFRSDQPVPATPWGETIYALGRRYALNPRLIAAVVGAESAFDADALSHKGAQGLMQIMPATAARFGISGRTIFEPATNLEVGVRYLALLRDRYDGDPSLMLSAYNAGETTVGRFGGVPPYRETRGYLRRVEQLYAAAETAGSG